MIRFLSLLLACSLCAQQPAPDAPAAWSRLRWQLATLADYERAFEEARKAEINELDLLIPMVDAYVLFGDVPKLKEAYAKAYAARQKIIQRAKDEPGMVTRSLKIAKKFLDFAKVRPAEAEKRAAIYRGLIFAQVTLAELEMLNEIVSETGSEKKLKEGAEVPWEDIRKMIDFSPRLAATGATVFGDKLGPFTFGSAIRVPKPTWEKLKEFVPAGYFGKLAPEGVDAVKPPCD